MQLPPVILLAPRRGFRPVEHPIYGRLYLPRGFGYNAQGKLWRVVHNGRQLYYPGVQDAWRRYCQRGDLNHLIAGVKTINARQRSRLQLDTGITGVNIATDPRRPGGSVSVRVWQTIQGRNTAASVGACTLSELNQQWLNEKLRWGAALRWHWFALHRDKPETLTRTLTVNDIPPDLIPGKPIKTVTVNQVLDLWDLRHGGYCVK